MADGEELGTLICVILKAQNLNDKHSFYKQDVFAQVTLNGVTKKTKVDIKGGQHPVWDDEVRYPIMKDPSSKYRKLEVSCWAKEPRTDDLLGKGVVDIEETLKTGEFDDWVKLELNGVFRGEVYLEMTFYSSAPAPARLAVPKNAFLERRPSKLTPAERLRRPPQQQQQPLSDPASRTQLRTDSTPPSRSSPRRQEAPLPPLPDNEIHAKIGPRPPQSQAGTDLPSILKPGGGANHARRPSGSPPRQAAPQQASQGPGYNQPTGSLPYSYPIPPTRSDYAGTYSQLSGQDPWAVESTGTLSFPMPQVVPPTQDYAFYGTDRVPASVDGKSDLPDPYLLARYNSPLPLPPGSDPPSRHTVPEKDPEQEARIRARRAAEDEARRKKEQEDRDLELARQLDRELNVDTPSTQGRHMPGGW